MNELCPPHPLGVRPSGNAFDGGPNSKVNAGVWSKLDDELILALLELLSPLELQHFASTCRFLYAVATSEELWRCLGISAKEPASWRGSWRASVLCFPTAYSPQIDCSRVSSDTIHRPFVCANINLQRFCADIPARNALPRVNRPEGIADRPFILTQGMEHWPIRRQWTIDALLQRYGDTRFRAEAVNWPLKTYVDYMRQNLDESPLYLFDHSFVQKMALQESQDYEAPSCFGHDLLSCLGTKRPHHRWLIVGPERSGSTFHKDPNGTSAWNACITGSKYWIMFPGGHQPPPGVFVSADEGEVTSPLSIAEWLLVFHAEARRTPGCLEGVCRAGEIVHVPAGWWHLVVNLEDCIAVTQNFVPEAHLPQVLDFMQHKADQVSGFDKSIASPYDLFVANLQKEHSKALELAMARRKRSTKRTWDDLAEDSGFSFGFDV